MQPRRPDGEHASMTGARAPVSCEKFTCDENPSGGARHAAVHERAQVRSGRLENKAKAAGSSSIRGGNGFWIEPAG